MRYIKTFSNHSGYTEFRGSEEFMTPNVSHCIQENEVHYNPFSDPRLIIRYDIPEMDGEPIQLYQYYVKGDINICGANMFDKIEIDGAEASITDLDAASGRTELSKGEHVIKYTLKEPAILGLASPTEIGILVYCFYATHIAIPDSVIEIGDYYFCNCENLDAESRNTIAAINPTALECRPDPGFQ